MYKEIDDPKLYSGPVWDFDLAFGTLYHGDYQDVTKTTKWIEHRGGWLGKLASHEEFQRVVKEKYETIFLPSVKNYFEKEIDQIVNAYRFSMYMSSTRWQFGYWDVDSETEELVSWVMERKKFLEDYLKDPDSYEKKVAEYDWGTIPYYVPINEETQ